MQRVNKNDETEFPELINSGNSVSLKPECYNQYFTKA